MGGGAPLSGLGFTEVVPAADALGAGGPEAVQADGGGGQAALGEEDAGVPHADLQAAAGETALRHREAELGGGARVRGAGLE